MNVKDIKVTDLTPYWHNPRNNEKTVERLIKSIQEYGFNTPLVVNSDMVLITGHARLKAAKRLGLETVPCVVLNITDEQAKKYRIADNKIQELTQWDEDALFKELREIGDAFELQDIGFDTNEINKILGEQEKFMEEFEVAEAQPVQVEDYEIPEAETPTQPKFIQEKSVTKLVLLKS